MHLVEVHLSSTPPPSLKGPLHSGLDPRSFSACCALVQKEVADIILRTYGTRKGQTVFNHIKRYEEPAP
jgi:hypothetical protein